MTKKVILGNFTNELTVYSDAMPGSVARETMTAAYSAAAPQRPHPGFIQHNGELIHCHRLSCLTPRNNIKRSLRRSAKGTFYSTT
ncbi:hypothetical protein J437_LFUL013934 [Ladona fulva]|uniref:Uncharacterized protein n=1 Tax=Ladona fulva TaxID=123851 RepID=A0A8K0KF55_LADFU|nr:hypothetical protein J437_LFUL013934 [Ladona fulva]